MESKDFMAVVAGVLAWAVAIPAVQLAGNWIANGGTGSQIGALIFGVAIAAATTPLLSRILGWKTRDARIRGIALALGTAQTIDGLVYMFKPDFYSDQPAIGLASAGNIFFGAGLLGIFSVYT